jgi:hypothetical protein
MSRMEEKPRADVYARITDALSPTLSAGSARG